MLKYTNSEWGVIRSAIELNIPDIFKLYTGGLYGVKVKVDGRTITITYFTSEPNPIVISGDQPQVSDTVIFKPKEIDPMLISSCSGLTGATTVLNVQTVFGDASVRKLVDKYMKTNISLG